MTDQNITYAINYLKYMDNYGVYMYDPARISPSAADYLYNLSDEEYSAVVGVPKKYLFFYLSKEEQLKHMDDIATFGTLPSEYIPSNFYIDDDSFYSLLLGKLLEHKVVTSNYSIFRLIESIHEPKAYCRAIEAYYRYFGDNDYSLNVSDAIKKVPYEHKVDLINKIITDIRPLHPTHTAIINELKDDDAKYVLNNLYNSNDADIKDFISSPDFIYSIGESNINRQELSDMVLSKSYLYEDYDKSVYIARGVALLDAPDIARYVLKHFPSHDDFILIFQKMSYQKQKTVHSILKNNPEYARKYYCSDYFENLGDQLELDEALDILKNHVFIENSNFSELEKCGFIYHCFPYNKLFAINEALGIPNARESITQYLYEIIDDVEVTSEEVLSYPNLLELFYSFGINPERKENLAKFIDRFGNNAIKYIKSPNIVGLINMEPKDYDKFLSLFNHPSESFDMNKVNTIANVLIQRKFRIENEEDCTIFATIQNLTNEHSQESLQRVIALITKMNSTIDVSSMCNGMEFKEFVSRLFKHDQETINLLHNITDAYITKKRESYLALNYDSFIDKLNVNRQYNRQYLKKAFFKYNDISTILRTISNFGYNPNIGLSTEEKTLCQNILYNRQLIEFKMDPSKVTLTDSLKADLKILDSILEKAYDKDLLTLSTVPEDAKYTYTTKEMDDDDILSLITEINTKHVSEAIISDERLFNALSSTLNKYSIFAWKDTFLKLEGECDLTLNDLTAASIVTYFDKIDSFLKSIGKSALIDLLDIASVYASSSNKYLKLLNEENYQLICANPGPNAGTMPKKGRLALVPKYITSMYSRNTITIPSGEKTFDLSQGKKLKVSIGNIYDPITLTYGERTGACLRIGGVFNDLFDYCIENKNGFHIAFSDPKTGAFISRVSGFRNGNTVFLNELRNSLSDEYTNDDLVEVLKEVAKFLVESTKDDPHPIENVIVSNDYAMSNEPSEALHITSHSEAFNHLNFNITATGHVLYTAASNHKTLLPYKFGEEHSSDYRPYNNKVIHTSPSNLPQYFEQIYIINELLKGNIIENIEVPKLNIDNIKSCICGNGWLAYVDTDNQVHRIVIDSFKEDEELLNFISESINKYLGGNQNDQKNGKNNRV